MGKNNDDWDVVNFDDVVKFIDAACNLEASMIADIKRGKTYTDETVVLLSKFAKAARIIQPVVDAAQKDMLKLN